MNDGNAEYLSANQFIVYDFTMFDGWYTADTADKEEYYQASYSEALQIAIAADAENPFSEEYYDSMYAIAYDYWDQFDTDSEIAGQWNNRGDGLQLVMLIMALGWRLPPGHLWAKRKATCVRYSHCSLLSHS